VGQKCHHQSFKKPLSFDQKFYLESIASAVKSYEKLGFKKEDAPPKDWGRIPLYYNKKMEVVEFKSK